MSSTVKPVTGTQAFSQNSDFRVTVTSQKSFETFQANKKGRTNFLRQFLKF